MKINDRIYWISGGPWGYLGNAYAIKHSNGYVLVDTGSPEALDVIVKNLKYWNIDENKITHVLITHAHDDHTGCAHYFQKCGAKIVMGKEDAKMLEDGHLGEYSPCTNHVMPACKADILIDKDEILQIGELIMKMLCLVEICFIQMENGEKKQELDGKETCLITLKNQANPLKNYIN